MFDFGINVLLNPSSFIGPANQVISVINQLQTAIAKFGTGTGGGSRTLESEFTRLNQVVAQSKTTFESFGSATSNMRNSMGQIGQSAQQASQGFAIFGTKVNEIIQNSTNAQNNLKSLGPAFQNVSSSAIQLSNGITPLGNLFTQLANNARAAATGITPLGNLLTGLEARMAATSSAVTNTANVFRAGLSPSIASIGGPLNNLNSQLGNTSSGLANAGAAATSSATGFGRLREMFTGNRGLVFGLSATFGTITGVVFELQLMGDANKQVAESQAVVNELIAQGKEGTGQYQQAVQALGKDQRFLEFATRNLALAFTNFIPDILLVVNGVVQLTDKLRGTATAVTPAATAITQMGTAMTATTTTTTALGTAQTTLGSTFTSTGNALRQFAPTMAAIRTEQAGLILTTNGLGAAQSGMVAKTVLSRDAMRGLQGVMAATRAEEIGLIATTDALGNSFLTMGGKASKGATGLEAAGAAGGAGGIRGAIGGLLGRLGLTGTAGLAGGIATGSAALVTIFYEFVLKPGAEATSQRILEEGQKLDAANKTIASSTDELAAKVQSGTASITEFWQVMANSTIAESDRMIAKTKEVTAAMTTGPPAGAPTVAEPGKPLVRKDYVPGTPARTYEELTGGSGVDPNAQAFAGTQLGKGAEKVAGGKVVPGQGGVLSQFTAGGQGATADATLALLRGPRAGMVDRFTQMGAATTTTAKTLAEQQAAANLQSTQQLFGQREAQNAEKALMATLQKKVTTPAGTFPLAGPIKGPQFAELQALGTEALGLAKPGAGEKPGSQEQVDRLTKYGEAMQKIRDITTDTTAADKAYKEEQDALKTAQDATGKAIQATEESMHKHNETVLAMPRALAEATGQELEMSRVVQTAMGPAAARDKQLDAHIALMAEQSAAYTNVNAVQGESLQVQEQIVAVGNEIVGGAEQQSDAIRAVNIFWNEMNTSMAQSLLSTQQMSIASVDVTRSLTNQTEKQFLVNEGLLAGKQAAQQFIQETIVGVAQTEQFHTSLQQIADTMGVKLPNGLRATSDELQSAIQEMAQFGSTATTSAQMLNDRFGAAFKMVGGLMDKAIEGSKEFNKAWKELDLSAVPKGERGFFKDMVKDMADVKEKADAMTTAVGLTMTAISTGAMKGKQASAFIKEFGAELGKLGDMDPRLKPVTDRLQGFLDAIPDGQRLAGLRQYGEMWQTIVVPALEDGVITNEEIASIMEKLDARLKPLPERLADLGKAAGSIAPQFDQAGSGVDTFIAKMNKLDQMAASSNKNIANLGKILQGSVGGFTGGTITKHGEVLAETEEDKMRREQHEQRDKDKDKTTQDPSKLTVDVKPFQQAQTLISQISVNITKTVGSMVTNVVKEFSTLGTSVVKVMGGMVVSVTKEISAMSTSIMKQIGATVVTVVGAFSAMTGSLLKQTQVLVVSTVAAFSSMATGSMKQIQIMVVSIIAAGTGLMKGWGVSIVALATDTITAFALMSKGVQTELGNMYTVVVEVVNTMKENVLAAVAIMQENVVVSFTVMQEGVVEQVVEMADTSLETVVAMGDNIVEVIDTMANDSVEIAVNMSANVVTALEDMNEKGSSAASSFASSVSSSFGKVETAASNATSAVSDLADEVGQLDGMSAVVTVTTNFKTTGTPPKQTGDVTINKQMGAVIDAASAKSFQYGGSIETSHGPQMAIFGDNPGGQETVAFIPHDNPFPTLRKLEKLFKGRASSDIVSNALDKAGEIVIHATFVIENIMDGQKVGTTIAKKVFKKMRTR